MITIGWPRRSAFAQVLGTLTGRRRLLSALVGTGAAWALTNAGSVGARQEPEATPAVEPDKPVPVNLVSKIAGEDFANDWLRVITESELMTEQTHARQDLASGAEAASAAVDCSRFRSYSAMAYGAEGPITVRLEVSPDDGITWFWHPDGESPALQHPVLQGMLVAPRCRLVVVNRHPVEQAVAAWLVLVR